MNIQDEFDIYYVISNTHPFYHHPAADGEPKKIEKTTKKLLLTFSYIKHTVQ